MAIIGEVKDAVIIGKFTLCFVNVNCARVVILSLQILRKLILFLSFPACMYYHIMALDCDSLSNFLTIVHKQNNGCWVY